MNPLSLNSFADELLDIMPLMFREFARREDNALVHGKISCPQMVALNLAAERGEVTVGEIAGLLSSEKSSASVLLERLVRQKMMRRRHDKKDRRLVWMSLTPKGRKVINQILAQKRQSLKAIFGKLSAGERSQYLGVLRKVRTNLLKSAVLLLVCGFAAVNAFAAPAKEGAPAAAPAQPAALDVLKAYRLALKQSESVAITEKEIDLARSRFYRSFDYFLPTVHFEMNWFEQDVNSDGGGSGSLNFGRRTTPMNRFTFTQPIFSGFKEIAALRGSGADRKAQESAWRRAQELLFVDVMEAFYNVLSARLDRETLEKQKGFLQDRLKELDERMNLGRSRAGESKTALSDEKIVEADLVTARLAVVRAENLLSFYIGKPVSDYLLDDSATVNGEAPSLEAALKKARQRSDVVASEQLLEVAAQKVVAAQADLFPTVSLEGNYYTLRPGFQDGNDWDVTLKLDVPIFEVGTTLGDIKEAHTLREQQRLALQQALRTAELEIRDAFENLSASRAADEALRIAAEAAQENADLETADYRRNLVNNLDVLDSLRRSLDVRRRANDVSYEAKKSGWRYKIALGELPL